MTQTDLELPKAAARRRAAQAYVVPANIAWGRVALGFLLIIAAGVCSGCAIYGAAGRRPAAVDGRMLMWALSGVAFFAGCLLPILSVLAARRPEELLLGALLVHKYHLITEEQLDQALATQESQARRKRRLGEILVDTGLVTQSQLLTALAYQRSYEGTRPRAKDAERRVTSGAG